MPTPASLTLRAQLALKRALDVTGAVGMLAASAPLLLVIAAAVKVDSEGGVVFRQKRVG
ncbi:MAG TPA: sugar transferase, partial [Anaeromyxobacteraceae bacterium]